MSSSDGRLAGVFPVAPGGGLVVAGACLQASVQDAGEPAGEPAKGVVVFDPTGAQLVVERAGAGRDPERGEGLDHQGVDEPVVAHEPGRDDLLLARGAGDRAGAGVIPAGLGAGIAVRVVAELPEPPGAGA